MIGVMWASGFGVRLAAEGLWTPKVGDVWVYEVTVEAPREAGLPQGEGIELREGIEGKEAFYVQTREFLGKVAAGAEDVKYDAIATKRGGVVEKIDFMEITPTAIYARGSKKEGKDPGAYLILKSPLLLISTLSSPGDEWKVDSDAAEGEDKAEGPRFKRDFRFFGKDKVQVPAGEYEALLVRIAGQNGETEIRRSLWFQPGLGLVKEETGYYTAEKLLVRQTIELKEFQPGGKK